MSVVFLGQKEKSYASAMARILAGVFFLLFVCSGFKSSEPTLGLHVSTFGYQVS